MRNKDNKLSIIFDATLIAIAAKKNDGMRTGIYFVALNILKMLLNRKDVSLTLYAKPEFAQNLKKFLSQNKLKNGLSYYPGIPLEKLCQTSDIYYSPIFAIPNEIRHNQNIKKFITVYDVIPLVYPALNKASAKGSWFMELMASINIADNYFAISEYTKQDIIKYQPYVDKDKITVTPLAAAKEFHPVKDKETINKIRAKYKIPADKKYIFSLCTLEPRKNLLRTVKTFIEFIKKHNIDDLIFVLAGAHWEEFLPKLKKASKASKQFADKILYIGYVADNDLAPLYSGAEWFVYTSSYEGFGLPPLEAMSSGCPVITSNNTSLPEVIGNAGIMIDWHSNKAHLNAYEKYYFNETYRQEMAAKGLKRAAEFSWEKTASIMVNAMKKALDVKKTIPVVFITSKTYTVPTAAAVASLIANKAKTTIYDIHIITNNIIKEDAQALLRFNEKEDVLITLHPYKESLKEYETAGYYVKGACILKFDISDMFPKYDKILYLDGDMVIREDLAKLYEVDLKDNYVAAVGDFHGAVDLGFAERLKLDKYFNAGLMLINTKKIREEKLKETFYKLKKAHPEWQCMDQDVHNRVFFKKIVWLSPRYNLQYFNFHIRSHSIEDINKFYNTYYSSFKEMLDDAAVIHLTNYQKPWEYQNAFLHDEWLKYFKMSPFAKRKLEYKDKERTLNKVIRIEKKEGRKCCILSLKLFEKLKSDTKKYAKILGIPLYKKIKLPQKRSLEILGIPFYKKKIKENQKKTYICGIPLLKTKKKKGKICRSILGIPVKGSFSSFKYKHKKGKVNLLFDASVLSYGNGKTPARSGVYFVIYNVLKGFLKDSRLNIAFCCGNKQQKQDLKEVFKKYYKGYALPPVVLNEDVPRVIGLFDAYYTPLYAVPEYIAENKKITSYDIFYDLDPVVHPESFPDSKDPNFWFAKLVDSLNKRSVNFVISKYTRRDLLKYVPQVSAKNTITTLLAADESFHQTTREETLASLKKYNLPTDKKYIFSLCNLQPRKNLIRVIRTFLDFIDKHDIKDMVFILGGAAWSTFEKEFAGEMAKPECRGKILSAGYIDDKDLAPLYSGAHWFVYTSSFEGFGLPPLEAMQCGCPVITSNNTSLPEVVGNAGIMIDWDSDSAHVKAYETYYFNETYRQKMAAKGLKRAQKFSWDKCVNTMINKIIKDNQENRI